jgi:hypothetical protein
MVLAFGLKLNRSYVCLENLSERLVLNQETGKTSEFYIISVKLHN